MACSRVKEPEARCTCSFALPTQPDVWCEAVRPVMSSSRYRSGSSKFTCVVTSAAFLHFGRPRCCPGRCFSFGCPIGCSVRSTHCGCCHDAVPARAVLLAVGCCYSQCGWCFTSASLIMMAAPARTVAAGSPAVAHTVLWLLLHLWLPSRLPVLLLPLWLLLGASRRFGVNPPSVQIGSGVLMKIALYV